MEVSMTPTCNYSNCETKRTLWNISNDNSSPPYYESFTICQNHLEKQPRFSQMHEALTRGRYNRQTGNTVKYDGWTLNKIASTWKRRLRVECCECERKDQIWKSIKWKHDENDCFPYGFWNYKYMCDGHLPRKTLGKNPSISAFEGFGISPVESTWVVETEKKSSQRKRKNENQDVTVTSTSSKKHAKTRRQSLT